ncbi:MAG: hypothetical protein KUG79_09935 [Pseudomonadales bacterium]|nr:hypothetical protein [Pseudomonadales bacterium]
MRYLLYFVVFIICLPVTYLGIQTLASERIEVIELYTKDKTSHEQITRLWVVDYENAMYIRAGRVESGWYQRLLTAPRIKLLRNNKIASYDAIPTSDHKDIINRLFLDKYTWGESFFISIFGREQAIPIKLIPVPVLQP